MAFPFHIFSFGFSINPKCHVIRLQGLRAPDSSPGSYPWMSGPPSEHMCPSLGLPSAN